MNKVIKTLIISDFFLYSGWGLFSPIFAIFIVQNIKVGSVSEAAKVAGFASFIYWISKSLLQIPISRYFDRRKGEKDDFWFMFFGGILATITPFGFLFSSLPWHIYLFQLVYALGMAFFIPGWSAIFTRHIDKGKEAFEWALDSTSLGIGAGITGMLGGLMAAFLGFKIIFVIVGLFYFFSTLLLLKIRREILTRQPESILKIKNHKL